MSWSLPPGCTDDRTRVRRLVDGHAQRSAIAASRSPPRRKARGGHRSYELEDRAEQEARRRARRASWIAAIWNSTEITTNEKAERMDMSFGASRRAKDKALLAALETRDR